MIKHPRRPNEVKTCTDLYVHKIIMVSDSPCGVGGKTCVWEGSFKALIFNGLAPHTYSWSIDKGSIKGPSDQEQCSVQISGAHPLDFEISVTVSGASGTHTTAKPFVTTVMTGATP